MEAQRPQVPLLRSLEGLRLVSSLGIVGIHMLPHVGVKPPPGFDLFVDLFFVISGIVIGGIYVGRIHGPGDWGQFMRRRLARIYPLHLATLLFYVALGFVVRARHLAVDDPQRFDNGQILPNLFLVHAWTPAGKLSFNFVSWSISAEFLVYMAFPLIAWAVARRQGAGFAAVLLLLAAAVMVAERALHTPLYELRWNCGALRAVPSFALGVWLSAFGPRIAPRLSPMAITVGFHGAALLLVIAMFAELPGYALLAIVYLVVATAFLADLSHRPTIASVRLLSDNGRLTYSLYMLHVPVTTVFISFLFPRLLGHGVVAQTIGVALALIILFILAELSFTLFESPLRRWLGGGAARSTARQALSASREGPYVGLAPRGKRLER